MKVKKILTLSLCCLSMCFMTGCRYTVSCFDMYNLASTMTESAIDLSCSFYSTLTNIELTNDLEVEESSVISDGLQVRYKGGLTLAYECKSTDDYVDIIESLKFSEDTDLDIEELVKDFYFDGYTDKVLGTSDNKTLVDVDDALSELDRNGYCKCMYYSNPEMKTYFEIKKTCSDGFVYYEKLNRMYVQDAFMED